MAHVKLYVPEYLARRLREELYEENWSAMFQEQVIRALEDRQRMGTLNVR